MGRRERRYWCPVYWYKSGYVPLSSLLVVKVQPGITWPIPEGVSRRKGVRHSFIDTKSKEVRLFFLRLQSRYLLFPRPLTSLDTLSRWKLTRWVDSDYLLSLWGLKDTDDIKYQWNDVGQSKDWLCVYRLRKTLRVPRTWEEDSRVSGDKSRASVVSSVQ